METNTSLGSELQKCEHSDKKSVVLSGEAGNLYRSGALGFRPSHSPVIISKSRVGFSLDWPDPKPWPE